MSEHMCDECGEAYMYCACESNPLSKSKIHKTQDPKYGIKDNKLVNMATGKPIPDDEPVFMFRAKDINASDAIYSYAGSCTRLSHIAAVLERYQHFLDFCSNNEDRMKEPDTQQA